MKDRKFVIDVKKKVQSLSTDDLREFLIEILETNKSYEMTENMDLRLFYLIKNLIGYVRFGYVRFRCSVCDNDFTLNNVLEGVILNGYKTRFICKNCLNDIDNER